MKDLEDRVRLYANMGRGNFANEDAILPVSSALNAPAIITRRSGNGRPQASKEVPPARSL